MAVEPSSDTKHVYAPRCPVNIDDVESLFVDGTTGFDRYVGTVKERTVAIILIVGIAASGKVQQSIVIDLHVLVHVATEEEKNLALACRKVEVCIIDMNLLFIGNGGNEGAKDLVVDVV